MMDDKRAPNGPTVFGMEIEARRRWEEEHYPTLFDPPERDEDDK